MATYYFKCSLCHKSVCARSKYYRRYLDQYLCYNEKELSNHYKCKKCRILKGEFLNPRKKITFDLQDYPKFAEIQGFISLEAIKLKEVGLHNEIARQNFLQNVKLVLEQEGIYKYDFVIENNKLKGVKMILPFIGQINMEINVNKEI